MTALSVPRQQTPPEPAATSQPSAKATPSATSVGAPTVTTTASSPPEIAKADAAPKDGKGRASNNKSNQDDHSSSTTSSTSTSSSKSTTELSGPSARELAASAAAASSNRSPDGGADSTNQKPTETDDPGYDGSRDSPRLRNPAPPVSIEAPLDQQATNRVESAAASSTPVGEAGAEPAVPNSNGEAKPGEALQDGEAASSAAAQSSTPTDAATGEAVVAPERVPQNPGPFLRLSDKEKELTSEFVDIMFSLRKRDPKILSSLTSSGALLFVLRALEVRLPVAPLLLFWFHWALELSRNHRIRMLLSVNHPAFFNIVEMIRTEAASNPMSIVDRVNFQIADNLLRGATQTNLSAKFWVYGMLAFEDLIDSPISSAGWTPDAPGAAAAYLHVEESEHARSGSSSSSKGKSSSSSSSTGSSSSTQKEGFYIEIGRPLGGVVHRTKPVFRSLDELLKRDKFDDTTEVILYRKPTPRSTDGKWMMRLAHQVERIAADKVERKYRFLAEAVHDRMGKHLAFEKCERHLKKLRTKMINGDKQNRRMVYNVFSLKYGVCRHRAVLFKALCDRVGLPCSLVRGEPGGTHVWNVIPIGPSQHRYIVDVMLTQPDVLMSDLSKTAEQYTRSSGDGIILTKLRGWLPIFNTKKDVEVLQKLGQGAYGEVLKVRVTIGPSRYILAQKTVKATRHTDTEIDALRNLNHPCILKHHAAFANEADHTWQIYTECLDTTLKRYLLSPDAHLLNVCDSLAMLHGVASGMQYIHDKRFMHRDLKPDNLLLGVDASTRKPTCIRIADFGLTKKLEPGQDFTKNRCGTPKFMAPEIAHVPREQRSYNNRVDVWSFGVIAALSISGEDNIPRKPIESVRDGEPRKWLYLPREMMSLFPPNNESLKLLVSDCLWDDPTLRPRFSVITYRLEALMMIEFYGREYESALLWHDGFPNQKGGSRLYQSTSSE